MINPKFFEKDSHLLGMEDALTHDVFSALELLPRSIFLKQVLLHASVQLPQPLPLGSRRSLLWTEAEALEFAYWPGCRAPHGIAFGESPEDQLTGTEPDVVLESPALIVVVESKFRSPLGVPIHQLAREFAIASDLADQGGGRPIKDFLLLIVTPGYCPPQIQAAEPDRKARLIRASNRYVNLREGIKSYFQAAAEIAEMKEWVHQARRLRDMVDEHVAWTGWHVMASSFEKGLAYLEWLESFPMSESVVIPKGRPAKVLALFHDRGKWMTGDGS